MKTELKNIGRGQTFRFAGQKFVVLEHRTDGGTLVIAPFDRERRAFDDDDDADWETASLNEYLNGEYLGALRMIAGDKASAILEHNMDLTADDGTGRRTCDCVVGLLTADEYRRNRDVMPEIYDCWWLATRISASSDCYVRFVDIDGTLSNSSACNGDYAIVPALVLGSAVVVLDGEEPDNKEKQTPRRAIAIDFDGTLFTEGWQTRSGIGKPIISTIEAAKKEQRNGAELILWTTREGDALQAALHACAVYGIFFDAVNESCDDWKAYYGNDPRKIGATEYWDDRARNPGREEMDWWRGKCEWMV